MISALVALALAQSNPFPNVEKKSESPRAWLTEIRFGSFYPLIDRPLNCTGTACPYAKTFNSSSMILVEASMERELFQKFGTASIGFGIGYAEKFGNAVVTGSTETTSELTALRVLPMKVLANYRFDWAAQKYGIPLVPYVKLGLEAVYWWSMKGKTLEVADGIVGQGFSYGPVAIFGLSFLLDILDPRLARDFDSGMGVNHTYLFAEYNFTEITNFGATNPDGSAAALDLSARFFMFGLAFEY